MKASAAILLCAVLGACCALAAANESGTWAVAHCDCPRNRAIVCGKDGTSYLNKCWAECSGTIVDHEGRCGKLGTENVFCDCPKDRALVCGADGTTYLNECWAECSYTDVIHQGPCTRALESPPCACTKERTLVCGADGHSYTNACWAACSGTTVDHEGLCKRPVTEEAVSGSCEDDCDKSGFAEPVCGYDLETAKGTTYPSNCAAACAGISITKDGFCEYCPQPYWPLPVCDTNGYTWKSQQALECAGAEKAHDGGCEAPDLLEAANVEVMVTSSKCQKACEPAWEPVCGMNNKSYANKCRMECDGVELKHEGRCPIQVV